MIEFLLSKYTRDCPVYRKATVQLQDMAHTA